MYKRLKDVIYGDVARRNWFVFVNEHHAETYVERAPGESANDRNDRAIRRAAAWYAGHAAAAGGKEAARVVLVTDDAENRKKAESEGDVHQGRYSANSRVAHQDTCANFDISTRPPCFFYAQLSQSFECLQL